MYKLRYDGGNRDRVDSTRIVGVRLGSAAEWATWPTIWAMNFIPFYLAPCLLLLVLSLSFIKGLVLSLNKFFQRRMMGLLVVRNTMAVAVA